MSDDFPSFGRWCEEVLHPEDTHPWSFCTKSFYDEYRTKYAIAKLVRPERILEVGVRFGYSARSFLFAAPQASYIGLDFDEPSFGSYKYAPRIWAEDRLRACYPNNKINTFKIDTQKEHPFSTVTWFDLVHIDADHSYAGALHDMQTFWPMCRNTMVVDDCLEVGMSVRAFLRAHSDEAIMLTGDSLRSSALLVRTNGYG